MSWSHYLDRFHHERPGITEDTLGRALAQGVDPYQWLLEPVVGARRVLDLACGSAPVASRSGGRAAWTGVDLSSAELALARRRGGLALVRAEADRLPMATASFPVVVCSMAIMILQPLAAVLAEVGRVLVPGGVAVLLLPGSRPLTGRDLGRYARLMVALRRAYLDYPNDRALNDLPARTIEAGMSVVADERRRFVLPIRDEDDGREFVRSLYLPAVSDRRVAAGARVAAQWRNGGLGVPLRRIVLRRRDDALHRPAPGRP